MSRSLGEVRDTIEKRQMVLDTPTNAVEHPDHYNREGSIECIDEMVMVFGREVVKNFCLCNVWKYRYRAYNKNGEEDLRKSDWYMNKYKELAQYDHSQ